jgi:hypothetical protein
MFIIPIRMHFPQLLKEIELQQDLYTYSFYFYNTKIRDKMAIKKRFKARNLLLLSIIALSLFFLMSLSSALINGVNLTAETPFDHLTMNFPNAQYFTEFDTNDSSIIPDYTSNNNDGINQGGRLVGSPLGNAMFFNGSSQIVIPSSASLSDTNDFTISFWVNSTSTTAGQVMMSQWTGTTGWHIFRQTATSYRFEWNRADTTQGHIDVTGVTSGWHHVAFTFNNLAQNSYLDGVNIQSTIGLLGLGSYTIPLIIGADNTTSHNYFVGSIDRPLIVNGVMSGTDILNMYRNSFTRFLPSGTDTNSSIFIVNKIVNATLNFSSICQTFNGTSIAFKAGVRNGSSYSYNPEVNLTNCNITNYAISGNLSNISYQLVYHSNSFSSYSPIILSNSTSLTSFIIPDIISPNGTIISPSNQTYTNNTALNFSVNATDDRNLSQIQLFILNSTGGIVNQTNISVIGTSATASTIVSGLFEGIYTFFFNIVDGAGNVFTTVINTFTIDLTKPFIQIYSPLNNNYYNNISSLNFSTQDNSMSACWFVNSSGTTFINCFQNFSTSSIEGNNTWTFWANDTAGNTNFKQVNFTKDSIFPKIQYTSPTANNNSFRSQNFVNIAVLVNETNFNSMTFYLRNSSGIVHQDTFSSINNLVTYTNVSDGVYQYGVNITDLAGNINRTPEFTITLDTISPVVNITFPQNSTTNQNISTLNYTIKDINPNLCWYSINEGLVNSSTISAGLNFTNIGSIEGNNNWSVYCNDSAGNQNFSSVTFFKDTINPNLTIIDPFGDSEATNEIIFLAVNASDLNGIGNVTANITLPDNSSQVVYLDGNLNSTGFPIAFNGMLENFTIGVNQSCIVNLSSGKVTLGIKGNGNPNPDNLCSLISKKGLYGDFDANISFNLTNEQGLDYAINVQALTEFQTSANAFKYTFMGITNFLGQGKQYQVFGADESGSGYVAQVNTSDTFGKFRIKRTGNNFDYYVWNNTANSWIFLINQTLDLHEGMFLSLEAESTANNYGNVTADFTNFNIIENNSYYIGLFNVTSQTGTYFVNFTANDTVGNHVSQLASFAIGTENYPPSVPFVLLPYQNQLLNGNFTIQWVNSNDPNGDILFYTITLRNTDGTLNQTIVSNYGGASTNSYNLDTTTIPDGNYKIRVTAIEELTSQHLNSSDTSLEFSIINNVPIINFVFPTESNNSIYGRTDLNVNVSVSTLFFKNVTINLYNSTALISSINSTDMNYFVQFTNLTNGIYYFNATACDLVSICGNTETRKVTINQGLFGGINLTLIALDYPYVDVNVTYPIAFSFMSSLGSISDGILNLTIFNPDNTNQSFIIPYNSTDQLYKLNLLFDTIGNYPFTIDANSTNFGDIKESGTFLVRSPYYITVQLYNKDGSPLIDNFGFITVEYVGNQKINPYLENYLHPVATINWIQPAFHAPYINGNATIKLYEPQKDYVFRYINGQVKFTDYYSKPNVTKSLGENVYLGTQKLNGTSVTEQFVLTNSDLHQYFALFNWITLIILFLVGIISLSLFLVVPDKPQIALVFGILFAGVTILIRVGVFLFLGK